MTNVPRLPLAERPAFARKMIAVWRLHHLAAGEDLTVTVWPGEWPDDQPREVKGVPVVEDDRIGGTGAVMILGKTRGVWRACYQIATTLFAGMTADDLAICTAFMSVADDRSMKLWLHPDPVSGEVPMWAIAPRGAGD